MEHTVHRWRFPEWMPSAIKCIASDTSTNKLAIGREDGDIEICISTAKWHTIARIYGRTDFKLQKLAWAPSSSEADSRLFGVSLNGFIFEIDFSELTVTRIRDCYGGTVWDMAISSLSQDIVVGCEDGAARLFTIADNQLEYSKTYPTAGSRILCVAFHPLTPRFFLGCADGTIRCLDQITGRPMFRMTGDVMTGRPTQIWSLLILRNSTVVSGDNHGQVQFWDGKMGILLSTVQQHSAEILALAASEDERQVFASGADSRVICLKRVSTEATARRGDDKEKDVNAGGGGEEEGGERDDDAMSMDGQWVYTTAQRPHSHDVYALSVCKSLTKDGKVTNYLLSGGMDCKLCIYPLLNFQEARPICILPTPAAGLVSTILNRDFPRHHGLSVIRHRNSLDLWQLKEAPPGASSSSSQNLTDLTNNSSCSKDTNNNNSEFLLHVECKGTAHLVCAALSPYLPSTSDKNSTNSSGSRSRNKKNPTTTTTSTAATVATSSKDSSRLPPAHPASTSSSCSLLACSNDTTKLWLLRRNSPTTTAATSRDNNCNDSFGIRKLVLPEAAAAGSVRAMTFNNDGTCLVLGTSSGNIILLDINIIIDEENTSDNVNDTNSSSNSNTNSKGAKEKPEKRKKEVSIRHVFEHRNNVLQSPSVAAIGGSSSSLAGVISLLTLSSDGLWLAVSDAESEGRVYIYDMDRLRLHWTIPRCPAPVTALGYSPLSPCSLVVLFASNAFWLCDVAAMSLCPWSQCVPPSSFPPCLLNYPAPLQGVVFFPDHSYCMLLHGQGYAVYVNLDLPIPSKCKVIGPASSATSYHSQQRLRRDDAKRRKREASQSQAPYRHSFSKSAKRQNSESDDDADRNDNDSNEIEKKKVAERNFTIIQKYRGIVYLGCLPKEQLMIIENPWLEVVRRLPETLLRKRYAT